MSYFNQLKKEQPILFKILNHTFESKKIPHAFLLIGDSAHFAAHYVAKSIICEESLLACEECIDCQKIENHIYGDLIFADGKTDTIKKNVIEHIQNQFSKVSLEGKSKIYLLENIEYSTNEAMNSLLKMLEEPTKDIYAIFTCQNINRVLPTIISRCQIIQLLPNSKSFLINELKKDDVIDEDINILTSLFSNYDECKKYIDTEILFDLKNEVFHFIDDLYFHRENLIINVQTHLLKKYKEKESVKIFLNMLVLGLRDLFHVKHNISLTYTSFKSLFDSINDNEDSIVLKIEKILETEYLLDSNANVLLLMDSLMYKI